MKEETKIRKKAEKELKKEQIILQREWNEQNIGWLFRPLVLCPFPSKRIGETSVWERKNGNIRVRIIADPESGVPFGQDVLIILYLAYEAKRQKSRKITVNFYRDFCRMFGINPRSGRKYRLVQKSLERIRNSKITWIDEAEETREREVHFFYIEELDLYFNPKSPESRCLWEQYILLSERFWEEINKHKIPFNFEAVRYLKRKPAHLNFYLWLSYRVWTIWHAKKSGKLPKNEVVIIPFWGENGLYKQLSSSFKRRRDYKREIKKYLATVKEIWPKCPVEIDGDALVINITDEAELDILESPQTEGKRLRKDKEAKALQKARLPLERKLTCPFCKGEMKPKRGALNRKGIQQPDYFRCQDCGTNIPREALCPDCYFNRGERVRLQNELNGKYRCPECKSTYKISKYWDLYR